MFIPLGSDRPKRNVPWVTWGLIGLNLIVFMMMNLSDDNASSKAALLMLSPTHLHWYQFITYQFLHADVMHVVGNMFFLYVFGPHVEDRLQPWGFALFYLMGGVLAGVGHALLSVHPVLGASGSVCAVTGAYMVLFPDTHIKFFVMFYLITTIEIPATYVIAAYVALDLVGMLGIVGHHSFGNTAYAAHVGGYIFGFGVAMILLKTKILARERWDLLAMWELYQRRTAYSRLVETQEVQRKVGTGPLSPRDQEIATVRASLAQAITAERVDDAVREYRRLVEIDAKQVLSREPQQTVANYLMQSQQYDLAAKAYETFLEKYRGDSQVDQVTLILALIYTRYLPRPARAKELLTPLIPRLRDAGEKELASTLLSEAGA